MSCLRLITQEVGQRETGFFKHSATRKMQLSASFLFSETFVYLAASGLSCNTWLRTFSCHVWTLSCGMWRSFPDQGSKPRPSALGVWRLSHWTTRDVPSFPSLSEVDSLNVSCFILPSDKKNVSVKCPSASFKDYLSF